MEEVKSLFVTPQVCYFKSDIKKAYIFPFTSIMSMTLTPTEKKKEFLLQICTVTSDLFEFTIKKELVDGFEFFLHVNKKD